SGPTDAASAVAIIDQIDLAFASNDTADPSNNFEETFYAGTPALDAGGVPAKQVKARINFGQDLVYGISGNEAAFRNAYKGLAMLAVTDVSKMDEESYTAWMGKVVENLTKAQDGLLDVSARIGFNQQIVEKSQKQLDDVSLVQRTQISNYESVDPYEAVTRMNNLETQLQASYQVTSRLSSLSILNFLR
ncbi:flagellin, partial [Sulfitobacter sp.]|uniref:flagellin n=1 Tax=Sulfitobacter sp. TaxID=1903071 RepID=UPI0035656276